MASATGYQTLGRGAALRLSTPLFGPHQARPDEGVQTGVSGWKEMDGPCTGHLDEILFLQSEVKRQGRRECVVLVPQSARFLDERLMDGQAGGRLEWKGGDGLVVRQSGVCCSCCDSWRSERGLCNAGKEHHCTAVGWYSGMVVVKLILPPREVLLARRTLVRPLARVYGDQHSSRQRVAQTGGCSRGGSGGGRSSDVRDLSCLLTCSSLVKVRSHMLHCFRAMMARFASTVGQSTGGIG